MIGLKPGTVELRAYSRRWRIQFSAERRRLLATFPSARCRIEHVGSTAVPGLEAKPIIDMAMLIPSFSRLALWIRRIEAAGYLYKGEYGLPGRHFFTRGNPVAYHLHLVARGSRHWEDWILFRDVLRTDPDAAQRYSDFKQQLARRFASNRDAYTRAKTPFVRRLLKRARRTLNAARAQRIDTD